MDAGEKLALTKFWFAWDDATTRKALLAALLKHFAIVAERVFKKNADTKPNRDPTDWKGFALLRRNERNIRRISDGDNSTTIEFLVGAAALLHVDVREFFPETAEWVALATLHVASRQRREDLEKRGLSPREAFTRIVHDTTTPSLADARIYAQELLEHPPFGQVLTVAAVEDWLDRLDSDRAKAVRTVAAAIAAVIAEHDEALLPRQLRILQIHGGILDFGMLKITHDVLLPAL